MYKHVIKMNYSLTVVGVSALLASCSVLMPGSVTDDQITVKKPALQNSSVDRDRTNVAPAEPENKSAQDLLETSLEVKRLEVIAEQKVGLTETETLADKFSNSAMLSVSSNELPVKDFIHYIFGELLSVNYVMGEFAGDKMGPVTMRLSDKVSQRQLFSVSKELLNEKGLQISFKNGVYYITSLDEAARKSLVIGIGRDPESVPYSEQEVLQIISLDYGYSAKTGLVLNTFADVDVRQDAGQGVLFLEGARGEILKALEFFQLVDNPSPHSRNISAVKPVFLDISELIRQLQQVLANEGVSVATSANPSASVILTPIETTGQVIIFSKSQRFIDRVEYWVNQLDIPVETEEREYFIYQPQFARASDLGDSIAPLLGGQGESRSKSEVSSEGSSANDRGNSKGASVSNEELSMIVDKRTNSLVFYTDGNRYRNLLPLIQRLDTQPKQIMLEVVIAEVTLNDSFERGVEFALRDGNGVATTEGGFGLDGVGGFSYTLQGLDGNVQLKMFRDSSLVNILSRPSVVVRDGVAAAISVGTDIPVVGQTTSDPIAGERQTTQIEYRKTGIELAVTPTVNSKGVVIMTIEQSISNTVDGGVSVQGSPSIFERTLSTEVVADSGQTIVLGGLISENRTDSEAKVPGFGDLPLIGSLFRSDSKSSDKTELVVMVTPRIIERSDQWESIKNQFKLQFERLDVSESLETTE